MPQMDNILLRFNPRFEVLANLPAITCPTTISPENAPILSEVEAVREKGASAGDPQIATRYHLVFPGSKYLTIAVKVEESAPSVTPEVLAKYPRGIAVTVEGFSGGAYLGKDGGAIPYFRATRITPITSQTAQK